MSLWQGVHEALYEALTEPPLEEQTPAKQEWRRGFINGMRYTAGILGMPEGSTEYVWPETGTTL